ncbi:hypothetical protein FRC06_011012 [Ceratobasidium sp. 370]|nr:hypothetical protein FRC06_011012 [Ceratobasidium sp. 370]
MQREGRIKNDAALRALCEGLEMEMFGVGGYDGFVASIICDFKANGSMRNQVGENNLSTGDISPKVSPAKLPSLKQKKKASELLVRVRLIMSNLSQTGSHRLSLIHTGYICLNVTVRFCAIKGTKRLNPAQECLA